jgi:putative flippase GtrA
VARSILSTLTSHIPPEQLGRYLLVGVWNTAFAYGTFALFTYLLGHYIPASYMVASVLSSLLNITVSFLGYKWFVFRTRGNYLREWLRSVMVYSGAIVLGLLLLPPTVFAVKRITGNPATAPYIAGAILLAVQVVVSFLGHKNFSFRNAGAANDGPGA